MAVRTLRYNTFEGRTWKGATFVTDTDALAFCEAAQIYERNQQKAIVDLVRRLKTAELWSKMKAIYPFVGGTSSSHKFNLKDPRDADAAFRLTFSGGWTHSANGADPNGTNGYADTLIAHNTLTQNSTHISYYSRESVNALQWDMGAVSGNSGIGFPRIGLLGRFTDGKMYAVVNHSNSLSGFSGAVTNSQGLFIASRTSSTSYSAFRNDVKIGTATVTSNAGSSLNLYLGAQNLDNAGDSYSTRQCAFATIGDGLTDTDATNLYNIVDLYQKRLGRAV